MSSIWKKNREVTNDVKRNNFPLYKYNHSTFKFGYLYPVYVKRVYPTDSFRIRSAFDLKMMPIAFPVQSKMRANLHFFYVRNKNLWKGWQDFIEGLKSNYSHPHPYVAPDDSIVKSKSIYDFLGCPTTVVSRNLVISIPPTAVDDRNNIVMSSVDMPNGLNYTSIYYRYTSSNVVSFSLIQNNHPCVVYNLPESFLSREIRIKKSEISFVDYVRTFNSINFAVSTRDSQFVRLPQLFSFTWSEDSDYIFYRFSDSDIATINDFLASTDGEHYIILFSLDSSATLSPFKPLSYSPFVLNYNSNVPAGFHEWSDLGYSYYKHHQPLNALPFRAYQSIYFGYYANDVLQPLVIDGEKEYNKFILNDGDGLDETDYHLYRRNYELDFLTSAMPSPQAGPAPLVGISALGEVTITDANGVSTGQAEVLPSGEITKIVATSPLASIDHARTMMNIAALGFNINDLRNANALQRLAEQTMRSGYRYINWVKGQYGRAPEYRELDMPEFIGGYSREIDMRTVVSQADTLIGTGETRSGAALGDFAANGRVVGGQDHDIVHYCDDYGWIIGIMSVTPTPAYSQLLPKHMIAPTSPLDYANPFMNQIGMQPITYREVCPLQAYLDSLQDSTKSVDDVFGYQRPNYDDVGEVDEVHGEFRGTMKDYLINRQFDGRPELGTEFIEINPSEINDIFINQNPDDDVFIGHLAFKVDAKRPFPRVHVPSLGK